MLVPVLCLLILKAVNKTIFEVHSNTLIIWFYRKQKELFIVELVESFAHLKYQQIAWKV